MNPAPAPQPAPDVKPAPDPINQAIDKAVVHLKKDALRRPAAPRGRRRDGLRPADW